LMMSSTRFSSAVASIDSSASNEVVISLSKE
jgi:hypothetical protein